MFSIGVDEVFNFFQGEQQMANNHIGKIITHPYLGKIYTTVYFGPCVFLFEREYCNRRYRTILYKEEDSFIVESTRYSLYEISDVPDWARDISKRFEHINPERQMNDVDAIFSELLKSYLGFEIEFR